MCSKSSPRSPVPSRAVSSKPSAAGPGARLSLPDDPEDDEDDEEDGDDDDPDEDDGDEDVWGDPEPGEEWDVVGRSR